MVLTIFNAPMITSQLKQLLWRGLLRSKGRHRENHLMGLFADDAFAHMLDVAVDANYLSDARQAHGRRVSRHGPKFAQFNSPVAFIGRAGLRGEVCRAAVARLWPAPWAG